MIKVITPPATDPITAAEAMYAAQIDNTETANNDIVTAFIKAATEDAENELGRYLVTQTLDAYFDSFPQSIKLPPIQSVTSITYIDSAGDSQTLAADQYQVDAVSKPARIKPSYGNSWPVTRVQMNAVKVQFVAGYGDAADVPEGIKTWIKMRVKQRYDQPQAVATGTITEFPRSYVDGILDAHRVYGL